MCVSKGTDGGKTPMNGPEPVSSKLFANTIYRDTEFSHIHFI